jgi:mercuric reductase
MNNHGSHRRRGTDREQVSVGAMYRTDVRIESRCRWCHALIEVATRAQGQALERVAPREAAVFARISYRSCAATSLCTEIAFFCGEAHLSALRSSQSPGGPTFSLSIEEALQVGRAIFGPVLASPALEVHPEITP